MKKKLPKFKTDKEAANFLNNNDLTNYINPKELKKVNFELHKKDKLISLRLSSNLLNVIKQAAEKNGIRYQKLIRAIIEENIGQFL